MPSVDTGDLDQRIRIEAPAETRSSDGEVLTGWTRVAEVWAHIEPMRGAERFAASMTVESTDTVITVRWAPALRALTRKCRIIQLLDNVIYDVKDIVPIAYKNQWIEFHATSGLNAG